MCDCLTDEVDTFQERTALLSKPEEMRREIRVQSPVKPALTDSDQKMPVSGPLNRETPVGQTGRSEPPPIRPEARMESPIQSGGRVASRGGPAISLGPRGMPQVPVKKPVAPKDPPTNTGKARLTDEERLARFRQRAEAPTHDGESIDEALKRKDAAPKIEQTTEEKAAQAEQQRQIGNSVLVQAQKYRAAKSAPTGAWPTHGELGAGATLAQDGTTALVGKKNLMMTREKLDTANDALQRADARLRFAAGEGTSLTSGGTLITAKPVLTVPDNGPTQALYQARAKPADVTYADCQRNAAVSAGFDYVPGGPDCQQPVIPPGALGGANPIALMKLATRSSYDDTAFGRMDRFTNSAGERQARSVIGAAIPSLLTDYPGLQDTMDAMDAVSSRRTETELVNITEPEFKKHKSEQGLGTATWPDVEQQKASMVETKKVWNKYTLLSLCAEGVKSNTNVEDVKKYILNAASKGLLTNLEERKDLDKLLEKLPVNDAAAAYDALCKKLKINQYCEPKPGQVIGMVAPGASDLWQHGETDQTKAELSNQQLEFVAAKVGKQPDAVTPDDMASCLDDAHWPTDGDQRWNFHWAAVATNSANGDYITFENFSVEDPEAINDKQVINAFGSSKTFYDYYKESGFFGNAAVAMCFEKAKAAM
jgi:hypothetical protein